MLGGAQHAQLLLHPFCSPGQRSVRGALTAHRRDALTAWLRAEGQACPRGQAGRLGALR